MWQSEMGYSLVIHEFDKLQKFFKAIDRLLETIFLILESQHFYISALQCIYYHKYNQKLVHTQAIIYN